MIELDKAMRDTPLVPESGGGQTAEMLPEEVQIAMLKNATDKLEVMIKEIGASAVLARVIRYVEKLLEQNTQRHLNATAIFVAYYTLSRLSEFKNDPQVAELKEKLITNNTPSLAAVDTRNQIQEAQNSLAVSWAVITYSAFIQAKEFLNQPQVPSLKNLVISANVLDTTIKDAQRTLSEKSGDVT